MSVTERNQDLRMALELARVHIPKNLKDDGLCKDMCAVIAINLRRGVEDTEKSAKAWDKRAYHTKAADLRNEMAWAFRAAQVAEMLAYSPKPFDKADLARLVEIIPPDAAEMTERPRFKDVNALRGAAAAARNTVLKRK